VLIVDDDRGLKETLKAILAMAGYTVAVAGDGLEALEKIGEYAPHLILLDLVMPRMDGFAFVEELERRGLRSMQPILALSADARVEEKAARLRADDYVAKPFDMDELLAKVALLIGD
jgi:two-component system, OmpR family, response regulator MprA